MEYQFSPLIKTSLLPIPQGLVMVIRDDLLPGGTKQRATAPYLRELMEEGHTSFFYASPFAGFAQVALAYAAQKLGVSCTIVCEKDQTQPGRRFHPFSLLAENYGAQIILVDSLSSAEVRAFELSHQSQSLKIPLGLDSPIFRQHLKTELMLQWSEIEKLSSQKIKSLWLPLGSGTLARTFNEIVPKEVLINCVNVRVLDSQDDRIRAISDNPRIKIYEAPMKFHEEARVLPTVPSNLFYDAKLWDFIRLHAHDRDVWWNVAR
jgi:hypothetical protein